MTLGEGGRILPELYPIKHLAQGHTHFVNIVFACDEF